MIKLEEMAAELEQKLGLPLNEARAYLILAGHGSLSVPEVMEKIRLDAETTQTILNNLLGKGLIILQPGNPGRHIALHPRMALTNIFKTYEDQMIR